MGIIPFQRRCVRDKVSPHLWRRSLVRTLPAGEPNQEGGFSTCPGLEGFKRQLLDLETIRLVLLRIKTRVLCLHLASVGGHELSNDSNMLYVLAR